MERKDRTVRLTDHFLGQTPQQKMKNAGDAVRRHYHQFCSDVSLCFDNGFPWISTHVQYSLVRYATQIFLGKFLEPLSRGFLCQDEICPMLPLFCVVNISQAEYCFIVGHDMQRVDRSLKLFCELSGADQCDVASLRDVNRHKNFSEGMSISQLFAASRR